MLLSHDSAAARRGIGKVMVVIVSAIVASIGGCLTFAVREARDAARRSASV